ncbi:MAG: hypothetical protein ACWGQW_02505 [bacterium]
MKNKNGQIIIEENDCVQIAKGDNTATLGIVLRVSGQELVIWGRSAHTEDAKGVQFTVRCNAADVFYVGKGKLRPLREGEEKRQALPGNNQAAARPAMGMAPPNPPPNEPEPRSAPFTPAQQEKRQLPPKAASLPPEEPKVKSGIGGSVPPDSDSIDLRPRPTKGEDVDPKLLKPAVFSGPNARDIHGRPLNTAPIHKTEQPVVQQVTSHERPAEAKENPFGIPARKKVKAARKVRKGIRRRKTRTSDVGIPVAGEKVSGPVVRDGAAPESQVAGGDPQQAND